MSLYVNIDVRDRLQPRLSECPGPSPRQPADEGGSRARIDFENDARARLRITNVVHADPSPESFDRLHGPAHIIRRVSLGRGDFAPLVDETSALDDDALPPHAPEDGLIVLADEEAGAHRVAWTELLKNHPGRRTNTRLVNESCLRRARPVPRFDHVRRRETRAGVQGRPGRSDSMLSKMICEGQFIRRERDGGRARPERTPHRLHQPRPLFKNPVCLRSDHERKIAQSRHLLQNIPLTTGTHEHRTALFRLVAEPFIKRLDDLRALDLLKFLNERPAYRSALGRQRHWEGLPRESSARDIFVNQNLHNVTRSSIIRVVPVLDLRQGVAVHARGGRRDLYEPVASRFGRGENPVELARAIRDDLRLDTFYIADLDAIVTGVPQLGLLERLAESGLITWVDVGIRSLKDAETLRSAGVSCVIAATETVPGRECLAEIAAKVAPEALIFGLDQRDGLPLLASGSSWRERDAIGLVRDARSLGIRHVLILDVARVGSGRGVGNEGLIEALACQFPDLEIAVGGGVSDVDGLRSLARLGVSSALVGSAIHDGRIGPLELDALK
jgi:phosphoribosylformimino-5-aminoimidazole carboxamide ribotide isomerase